MELREWILVAIFMTAIIALIVENVYLYRFLTENKRRIYLKELAFSHHLGVAALAMLAEAIILQSKGEIAAAVMFFAIGGIAIFTAIVSMENVERAHLAWKGRVRRNSFSSFHRPPSVEFE